MDHFERLGVPRSPCLDADLLERRYFQQSRAVHPDLQGDDEAALVESAALNHAYRVLADRWERYAYLAELYSPGVLEANKKLCPTFLAAALERFEEATAARASEGASATLTQRVEKELADIAQRIERLLVAPAGAHDAAVLCHEARYLRRTLETLQHGDQLDDSGEADLRT